MSRTASLLAAAHLGPALIVTAVAGGLALTAGGTGDVVALVVVAVGAGQLSIGWSNDWIDERRGLDIGRSDKPLSREGSDDDTAPAALRTTTVLWAAVVAATICVLASAVLGPLAAVIHLVAVAGGWAYNLWLKSTVGSVLAYLLSFGLLPSVVTATVAQTWAPWWATVTGASFGAGVHFANVLPDLQADRDRGVGGLPQRVGVAASTGATIGLLGLGTGVVLAAGPGLRPGLATGAAVACAALLIGVGVAARAGALELAFRLSTVTGLVLVGLLVAGGAGLT